MSPDQYSTKQESPLLHTAAEVAGILRTSRQVVYEMNRKHRIPGAVRVGRKLLFRRDRLLQWLRESSVSSL
jgi:excisionase family DNA binding protein